MLADRYLEQRDQLAHAVTNLRSVGANLLGAVFTMMPIRGTGTYSYGYAYKYYGEDDSDVTRKAKSSAKRDSSESQHSSGPLHSSDPLAELAADSPQAPHRRRRQTGAE